jgi:hypothetical protein
MERRKFVITGAGIFLSMAFLGRNALKDDKNSESTAVNSKESVEYQIVDAIYPDSGQALHYLKLAVKENKVIKSANQEKFKKEILRVFKSSTRQEFVTFIDKEIRNDFVDEQVLTINEWLFSEFECRFWLVFG